MIMNVLKTLAAVVALTLAAAAHADDPGEWVLHNDPEFVMALFQKGISTFGFACHAGERFYSLSIDFGKNIPAGRVELESQVDSGAVIKSNWKVEPGGFVVNNERDFQFVLLTGKVLTLRVRLNDGIERLLVVPLADGRREIVKVGQACQPPP
jgi:hypothetical protein